MTEDQTFSIPQAVALLNQVVAYRDVHSPRIEDLGVVSGLLVLNDEPEVLVKFIDRMEQSNRGEFCARYRVVPEGEG